MTTRPTITPLWATDTTFSDGVEVGLSPRLDPGAGVRAQGIKPRRRWPARWFNFARGIVGDWVDYLDQKTKHNHNILNFGADPTGANDSTTAIANAITAASLTGGNILLPQGSYRHDDSLHPVPGVHWIGVPDKTFLNINHATKPQLQWDVGGSGYLPTEIFGIGFGALVDNTGASSSNPAGNTVRARYRDCSWNYPGGSPKLKGRLLLAQAVSSVFSLESCYLRAIGDAAADALFMSCAGGELWVRGSRLVMPTTYSSKLIEVDDGTLHARGNYFDVTAHSGSADIISLLAGGFHVLKDNEFYGAFSSGACVKTVAGGIKLSETGSVFDTVNPYNLGGALDLGSELTLGAPITTTFAGSGTITCATGYRAQTLRLSNGFGGVGPSIALPVILFMGQTFELVVVNASAATNWTSGIGVTGGVVAGAGPTNFGYARAFRFKAMDPDGTGTPRWFQMGDASSAYSV